MWSHQEESAVEILLSDSPEVWDTIGCRERAFGTGILMELLGEKAEEEWPKHWDGSQ